MANKATDAKTTDTKTKGLYGAGWDEQTAIDAGYSFTDVFGKVHGLRPTTPDEAVANNPVTAEEKDAEAALAVVIATREAALTALQEGMRSDPGTPAVDYNTGKGFMMFSKRRAAPATLEELKADFKAADDAESRARVKLSHIQERRAEAIRRWNEAQIVDSPLAKAIAVSQRNRTELTESEARALGARPIEVMGYKS
jgi:hypothetical protein